MIYSVSILQVSQFYLSTDLSTLYLYMYTWLLCRWSEGSDLSELRLDTKSISDKVLTMSDTLSHKTYYEP